MSLSSRLVLQLISWVLFPWSDDHRGFPQFWISSDIFICDISRGEQTDLVVIYTLDALTIYGFLWLEDHFCFVGR